MRARAARRPGHGPRWSLRIAVALLLLASIPGVAVAQPSNGELPRDVLRQVGGVLLAAEPAAALQSLLVHAARDGAPIVLTDGYRSYDAQVDVKRRKGWLAATPGTSMHGWGRAIDVDLGRSDMAWLHANGPRYGWELPPWARPDGSKPEPWHWEYVGPVGIDPDVDATSVPTGPPDHDHLVEVVVEPGERVGQIRLEPADDPEAGWVPILEGVDDLTDVVGHYPGTALPGDDGNLALAGYRTSHGAPLAGLHRLRAGDRIEVRDLDGTTQPYLFAARAIVDPDAIWAIDADPLGLGNERLVTVTTAAPRGRLRVTWFTPEPVVDCPTIPQVVVSCGMVVPVTAPVAR